MVKNSKEGYTYQTSKKAIDAMLATRRTDAEKKMRPQDYLVWYVNHHGGFNRPVVEVVAY